jgi:hypothetical protein
MPIGTSSSEGVDLNSLSSSLMRSGDEGMLPSSRTETNMDVISDLQLPGPLRVVTLPEAAVEVLVSEDTEIEVVGPEATRRISLSEAMAEDFVPMDTESEGPGPEGFALTDGPEVEGEEGNMEVEEVEGDTEVEDEGGRGRSSSGTGLDVTELIAGGVQGMYGGWLGDSPGR